MKNLGNVFILGDSYSTFKGYIPEGYCSFYSSDLHLNIGVISVEQTWWHQVLQNTNSNLTLNSSYSGTTICHTGYGGEDCSKTKSFIFRLNKLIDQDFFKNNKIDTFFIFGGTNDTWANSPLGKIKYENRSQEDLFSVMPAFCHLIETVKTVCPDTRIITIANDILKPAIIDCFKEVTNHFGTELIILQNIAKQEGHPDVMGMKQISEQVLEKL